MAPDDETEEFDITFDEPEEGDYTTEDHRTFFQYGKIAVSVSMAEYDVDTDAGLKAVAAHMGSKKFWPNVWFISDHGNAHLLTMPK